MEILRTTSTPKEDSESRRLIAHPGRGLFPDEVTFRKGLDDSQCMLFDYFISAASKTLPKQLLQANPLHLSIRIPIKLQSTDSDNTLCRIMTAVSYETRVPLDRFILLLGKRRYEAGIEAIEKAVTAFPIKAELLTPGGKEHPPFYENGEAREAEYRILFHPGNADLVSKRDEIVAGFIVLLEAMKEAYSA